ncbi:GILT-like protein 1 [Anthonomus grandis grandis]|uniref:GILT-like protein 1 n=1 Tax=Anthonomus grandis grandis TaxID=2921223 RepID=UPI0021650DF5|nr:GILT-like protein 1 [Anthonomus grandis grandis]
MLRVLVVTPSVRVEFSIFFTFATRLSVRPVEFTVTAILSRLCFSLQPAPLYKVYVSVRAQLTNNKNMIFNFAFVLCFATTLCWAQHEGHGDSGTGMHMNHEKHWVNVSVYYESLCPDSRKFFTQQLYPSLQGNLSNYVNLTLVPFGKATAEFTTAEYKFTCHHGPAECEGNKIQACALKLVDNGKNSEGAGFNRNTAGFINCLMDKTVRNGDNATFPIETCASINKVINMEGIKNCTTNASGSNYLAELGQITKEMFDPIKSVPTIVFNGKFKMEDNNLAQTNFVKALCQYIQGDKPSECKNGANNLQISVVFLLMVSLITKFIN